MGAWASAALLLDTPVRLVLQARLLVSPGDPVAPMAANVLGTTWGNGLALQAIAALAALAGFVLAKRARAAGWILALAAALALALSFSLMGHAVAPERGVALSVLDDWLHVLSAGGWTGTLAVVVTASMTLRRSDDGGAVLATVIALFHRVAMMCLVTLLASGTISVLLRVQHLRDLFGATYGTLLFAKLALVGVVAGFGWYHARTAESRTRRAGTQSVARTLAVETGLAVLVILVTAVLVGTEPPGGM